jgi:DNA invertase Pin-like site-specific DNA recombinase
MPIAPSTPRSRHKATDLRARRSVRAALYQRRPKPRESDLLRSYVASRPDWRIRLHSTDDASGSTLKRPRLQRVLEAARTGSIDVLVITHVHSLSRKTRHLAFLLNELTSRGVRVVSATQPFFDTENTHDVFLVHMLSAVADIEETGALEDRRVRHREKAQSVHESQLAGQP